MELQKNCAYQANENNYSAGYSLKQWEYMFFINDEENDQQRKDNILYKSLYRGKGYAIPETATCSYLSGEQNVAG